MDYLSHVEHNAENLQFYLWYNDYVLRFNALPSHQRALSPEWLSQSPLIPNLPIKGPAKHTQSSTNREILGTIMRHGYDTQNFTFFSDDSSRPLSIAREINLSEVASSVALTEADSSVQNGLKWQPCTYFPSCTQIT